MAGEGRERCIEAYCTKGGRQSWSETSEADLHWYRVVDARESYREEVQDGLGHYQLKTHHWRGGTYKRSSCLPQMR
jgi:hypothetical protein